MGSILRDVRGPSSFWHYSAVSKFWFGYLQNMIQVGLLHEKFDIMLCDSTVL